MLAKNDAHVTHSSIKKPELLAIGFKWRFRCSSDHPMNLSRKRSFIAGALHDKAAIGRLLTNAKYFRL